MRIVRIVREMEVSIIRDARGRLGSRLRRWRAMGVIFDDLTVSGGKETMVAQDSTKVSSLGLRAQRIEGSRGQNDDKNEK